MSDNIVHVRQIIPSAAEKLIRKYPTVYGAGLSEETVAGIASGNLKAEVVTYEDGNRGIRVATATAAPKPKSKKTEVKEDAPEVLEAEIVEPVVEDSTEEP